MTLHPRPQPLTPYALQGRLRSLDLSIQGFAGLTGVDGHTARRWVQGEALVPRWVTAFLDLLAEKRDLEYSLAAVERARAELLQRNRALFTG